MRLLKRLFQRLLILGLGILSIWLIVFVIFETADRRLPWLLALGLTYGIAAYIILPRTIRIGLKILQRKLVPSFTITGDGTAWRPRQPRAHWHTPAAPYRLCSPRLVRSRSIERGKLVAHDSRVRIQLALSDRPV